MCLGRGTACVYLGTCNCLNPFHLKDKKVSVLLAAAPAIGYSTRHSHLIFCVHGYRVVVLHCAFTLPSFRKQEATWKWKCCAAAVSREGRLSVLESTGSLCLNTDFPYVEKLHFVFYYSENIFGDSIML